MTPNADAVLAPWSPHARLALLAADTVAASLVVVAWAGAADTAALHDQIGWLNLAVVGAVVGAAANASWLLAGRRAVGRRRRRLLADVGDPSPAADAATRPEHGWQWVPGTRRAHRDGCPLAAGKQAVEVDAARIAAERLVRCELCGVGGT